VSPDGEDEPGDESMQQRQEVLSLVRVILEREMGRSALTDSGRQAVERLLDLVRAGDVDALADSYRYHLSQVEAPSDDLGKARTMLDSLVGGR
jgi:hypothetical protein